MSQKFTKLITTLAALASLGWINSLYTLWHQQNILAVGLEKPSFCAVNEHINCDVIALSKYSSFLGFSTSAWAMLFYFTIILLIGFYLLFSTNQKSPESGQQYISIMSWALALSSLPFTFIQSYHSFITLRVLCPMCLLTYFINLSIIFATFLMMKASRAKPQQLFPALKNLSLPVYLIGIIGVALHLFLPTMIENSVTDGNSIKQNIVETAVAQHFQSPIKNISTENAPDNGAKGADVKITIVEYSDFQCPFCARSAATLTPLVQSHLDKIRVIFKNYPLDSTCNSEMKSSVHEHACRAAAAGVCVFKAKGSIAFFAYKKEIFEKQKDISSELIQKIALKSGLSSSDYDSCIKDPSVQQFIADQIAEGTAAGVNSTPSIYINGRKVGSPHPKILQAIIDAYLK